MSNMGPEANPIDKMAELRRNYAESRKREAEEETITRKRRRTALIDSDDELETITSRRVKRPPSPFRRRSEVLQEARSSSTASAQNSNGPTRRNSEATTSPTDGTQKPKTRLTSNGAKLYICHHPGCERACRDLERLKIHSEKEHPPDTSPDTNNLLARETDTSDTVIKVEGVDPNLRPQQSSHEEGSAPRAKPQPNRCRDRLNHPLFMSPDPASLPSHEQTPSPEKAMQTDAAHSGANLGVPENATSSDPRSLRLAIPNETNKADKGRHLSGHIHLTQPLRCPVRICSKTFKSRTDFDDHKSHGHKGQRLLIEEDGSFSIIDTNSNRIAKDLTGRLFVCCDCQKTFLGVPGLEFHKSKSVKCKTPVTAHPELLAFEPAETQSSHGKAGPITPSESSESSDDQEMNGESRDEENSVTKTFHNYDADRRRRSSRPAVSATSVREFEQKPSERESDGLRLGDMGLSSDLSDDEVSLPGDDGHQVTPSAEIQVGSKDRLSVQKEASGPTRALRSAQRLLPDPDSWAEASDADKRLVAQGQYNVPWKLILRTWRKSTGLPTGHNTLQLRYYRLVPILGDEASKHAHLFVDSGDENEADFETVQAMNARRGNARAVRKRAAFPISWEQASQADRRMVAMKEKGHMWRSIKKVFEKATQQDMREQTLKYRYNRLVSLKNQAESAQMENEASRAAGEQIDGQRVEDIEEMSATGNSDDRDSDYEVNDESSEDENALPTRKDTHMVQERVEARVGNEIRSDDPSISHVRMDESPINQPHPRKETELLMSASEQNSATDPDTMLAALLEGKERWPKLREDWENATNRKTAVGDLMEKTHLWLGDENVNLLLAADAIVEERFAQAKYPKYPMIADIMRTTGFGKTEADLVAKNLSMLIEPASSEDQEGRYKAHAISQSEAGTVDQGESVARSTLASYCQEQIASLQEASRAILDTTLETIRQETGNLCQALTENVLQACFTTVKDYQSTISDAEEMNRQSQNKSTYTDQASQTNATTTHRPDTAQPQPKPASESPGYRSSHESVPTERLPPRRQASQSETPISATPHSKSPHPPIGPKRPLPKADGASDRHQPRRKSSPQTAIPQGPASDLSQRISHSHICLVCNESFPSRKLLNAHLSKRKHFRNHDIAGPQAPRGMRDFGGSL